jgi:glycosyltransferase involved in cell wall biosynthesis
MIARLLAGALHADVRITVAAPDTSTAEWIASKRPGTEIVAMPPVKTWRSVRALWGYRNLIRRINPDIVQLTLPMPSSGTRYLALLVRAMRGVRCVGVQNMYGDAPRRRSRVMTRLAMQALDAHVAIGPSLARIIERQYALQPGSIRPIPAAVARDVDASPHRIAPGPVVGVVARLSPEKGIDVLLHAMARWPEIPLVVVGEGGRRAELEALARELGRAESTWFVGFQQRPQDFIAGMDLFVLPSRREGLGLVLLEAMRAELPVVASDVGGIRDLVEHDVTGILVPPEDPAALADAIERLLADSVLRARLGASGRARLQSHFTTEQEARAYEALYDELVPPATRARRPSVTT